MEIGIGFLGEEPKSLTLHWPLSKFVSQKDWFWNWSSRILVTSCEWLMHWKSLRCWERLKEEGEDGVRGWDDWMASLMQWTWTWKNSGDGEKQGGLSCCGPWVTRTWLGDWTTARRIFHTLLWSTVKSFIIVNEEVDFLKHSLLNYN